MTMGGLSAAPAQSPFSLINDTSLINHWPGNDGLIGSADDVVSGEPSLTNASAPNADGTASFNAFDFQQSDIPDANLFPPDRQAITFLHEGSTVTINDDAVNSGEPVSEVPLFRNWTISGTPPFPNHGPYTAAIAEVASGSYNRETKEFSQTVTFTANLTSGLATSSDFELSGMAWIVTAEEFDTGTGDAYVDEVLIPIAEAAGARRFLFASATGTVPAADNGGFPAMDITAAVFGIEEPAVTPVELSIERLPGDQVQLSWEASEGAWQLQATTALAAEPWSDVSSPPPTFSGNRNTVTLEAVDPIRLFRLRANP